MRAVCDPHLMLRFQGRVVAYASRVSRLSSRAQRTTKWCAADPGPKYPGIRKRHGRGTWIPALATLGRDDNGGNGAICDCPAFQGKEESAARGVSNDATGVHLAHPFP